MSELQAELQQAIDRVFALQQQNRAEMCASDWKARKRRLKKVERWVVDHQAEIRQALYADFKKPPEEVDLTEIFITLSEIRHALRHLKSWMKPVKVKRTLPVLTAKAWIQYKARGVVLIISPWNFPFHLTVAPLISALAAGNCVILKPSEFVPHVAQLLKKMVEELFPPQEVALFLGDHRVAEALLKKPFDHIFFTGSTRTGKLVMRAAAEHLSSVTLELGGKSPVIVDQTANLKDAAKKIAFGKYINSGQTCIAPDYVLVHRQVREQFEGLLKNEIISMFGADARQQNVYARVINDTHHQRLTHMIQTSVEGTGELLLGGESDASERFISPTLIRLETPDGALMKEEIFGPILPLISFESVDEALNLINQIDKPLGLYIFSHNRSFIERIIQATDSGAVCINDAMLHYIHPNLPFGGVGPSGQGNAHGFYGFRAFSYERAMLRQGAVSPLKWLYPPYSDLKRKLIGWIIKYFT